MITIFLQIVIGPEKAVSVDPYFVAGVFSPDSVIMSVCCFC